MLVLKFMFYIILYEKKSREKYRVLVFFLINADASCCVLILKNGTIIP